MTPAETTWRKMNEKKRQQLSEYDVSEICNRNKDSKLKSNILLTNKSFDAFYFNVTFFLLFIEFEIWKRLNALNRKQCHLKALHTF